MQKWKVVVLVVFLAGLFPSFSLCNKLHTFRVASIFSCNVRQKNIYSLVISSSQLVVKLLLINYWIIKSKSTQFSVLSASYSFHSISCSKVNEDCSADIFIRLFSFVITFAQLTQESARKFSLLSWSKTWHRGTEQTFPTSQITVRVTFWYNEGH